jgi:hypothetical protein
MDSDPSPSFDSRLDPQPMPQYLEPASLADGRETMSIRNRSCQILFLAFKRMNKATLQEVAEIDRSIFRRRVRHACLAVAP